MPRPRLKKHENELIQYYRSTKSGGENILIIGDIHEPFSHKDYLKFCAITANKYSCDRIIFIGDLIDNHFASYHEIDPDGMSAGDELELAIKRMSKWYKAFPKADMIYGNHDRMIMRKAFSSGISKHWIKDFKEVIGLPNWEFHERLVLNDVQYVHGEGKKARSRAKSDLQSTVSGHYHTDCYVDWFVGNNYRIFAMQTGCGIDRNSYAMAYGKHFSKPAIACGLVLNGGKNAFVELMELE